jgi:hypothetical protein
MRDRYLLLRQQRNRRQQENPKPPGHGSVFSAAGRYRP